jgi:hypothetical protein
MTLGTAALLHGTPANTGTCCDRSPVGDMIKGAVYYCTDIIFLITICIRVKKVRILYL